MKFVNTLGLTPEDRNGMLFAHAPPIKMVYAEDSDDKILGVAKKFPVGDLIESGVVARYDDKSVQVTILRGCLDDYIAMLENDDGKIPSFVKERLKKRLDDKLSNDKSVVEQFGQFTSPQLFRLLRCFYM